MRIAAVSYGTDVHLQFNLGDDEVNTINKAVKAIDDIQYMGGATATTEALELVRDVVVPLTQPDSDRVMIFITDGKSNLGKPPKDIAQELNRDYDFEVYAIGKKIRSHWPVLGPVHTYPFSFEDPTFSLRIRLPSTRIR